MTNINVIPEFIMSGAATFTVSNGRGGHFTYHIYKPAPSAKYASKEDKLFAQVLCGPDNTNKDYYKYLAMIILPEDNNYADPRVVITRKSIVRNPLDTRLKTLQWALRVIWQRRRIGYQLPAPYSIKHEGKCGRCGAKLTHPASLDTGLGPECAAALGVPHEEYKAARADNGDKYDPSAPISIFNHPPFSQMSLRQADELDKSWP